MPPFASLPCVLAHSPEMAFFLLAFSILVLLWPLILGLGVVLPPLLLLRPKHRCSCAPSRTSKFFAVSLNLFAFLYCQSMAYYLGQCTISYEDKVEPMDSLLPMLIMAAVFIGLELLTCHLRKRWCLRHSLPSGLPPIS